MAIFSTCQTIELARNSKLRAGPIFSGMCFMIRLF